MLFAFLHRGGDIVPTKVLGLQNQMMDAMTIWDGICSLRYFRDTDMVRRPSPLLSGPSHPAPQILFLNKVDLFERRIQYSPINKFFPVRLPLLSLNSRPCSFGMHEFRITQVQRKTPRRARNTSESGLCELLPRVNTGNKTGPRLGEPLYMPLGPCTISMSRPPLTLVEKK